MIIKIPFSAIRKIRIVDDKLTAKEVYAKYKPDYFINGVMYDDETGRTITRLKDNGVKHGTYFTSEGIGVKDNNLVWCRFDDDDVLDFAGASPILRKNGKIVKEWGNTYSEYVDKTHYRSALGFESDTAVLYVSDREEILEDTAENVEADYLINLDGGGSCHLQNGSRILKNSTRANTSWILFWCREGYDMKTNLGLVEHCKMALSEGWGYVWGTYGSYLSEYGLSQKAAQYPQVFKADRLKYIRDNYLGKRTVDCGGLVKSYLWWNSGIPIYTASSDLTVDTMLDRATDKGEIATIPEIPGLVVWYKGHAGVYIGNGNVIEARGTLYGVVQTRLSDRPFTHWFKHNSIEYVQEIKDDVSDWAKPAQKWVIDNGISDGTRPKDTVTREEIWTMMYRKENK